MDLLLFFLCIPVQNENCNQLEIILELRDSYFAVVAALSVVAALTVGLHYLQYLT